MKNYSLLGYTISVLESDNEIAQVVADVPPKISLFGFDTETDTKIDMVKRDASNIDIMHDHAFLVQFGYDHTVYVIDLRLPDVTVSSALTCYETYRKRATLSGAHNIKFDISMLLNLGLDCEFEKCVDTMSIARLALESKSEREGGYAMGLKSLAGRLLGSQYTEADKEIDKALSELWTQKLKELAALLKPYGITRRQINETLKDVTGSLDEYTEEVQRIWYNWNINSKVSYADINPDLLYRYGAIDVIMVLELMRLLLPIVKDKQQMEVLKREMDLIMPLVRMERTGYTVDKKYLIKCKQALTFEISSIRSINEKIVGRDISPSQHQAIKDVLYDKFGYVLKVRIRTECTFSFKRTHLCRKKSKNIWKT